MSYIKSNIAIILCLLVSLIAMSGSLYYSEALYYYPCSLCRIQRILMYPLNVLFLLALIYSDSKIYKYVLPISILGVIIAGYHYVLQRGAIPQDACYDATCGIIYVDWLGFITIPFQSLVAFLLITIAMVYQMKRRLQ